MSKLRPDQTRLLTAFLFVFALCVLSSESFAQNTPSNLKAVLAGWKGKDIWFNNKMPACKLTELHDDYFVCELEGMTKNYIPYTAICRIEAIGEKDPILKIYLMYYDRSER